MSYILICKKFKLRNKDHICFLSKELLLNTYVLIELKYEWKRENTEDRKNGYLHSRKQI